MKIRNDFVTNSSSSSFIIGKNDDETATVENIYQLIRGFYMDLFEKCKIAEKYCGEHPRYPIIFREFEHSEGFRFKEDNRFDSDLFKQFETMFGFSMFETFWPNEWLKCETYEKYKKFWIDKINKSKSNDYWMHAPFDIYDLTKPQTSMCLHARVTTDEPLKEDKIRDELVSWYYPYFDDFENTCDNCSDSDWCSKDECKETKEILKEYDNPKEKPVSILLGKIYVSSECGYINDFVVEKLSDMSLFHCNHMG